MQKSPPVYAGGPFLCRQTRNGTTHPAQGVTGAVPAPRWKATGTKKVLPHSSLRTTSMKRPQLREERKLGRLLPEALGAGVWKRLLDSWRARRFLICRTVPSFACSWLRLIRKVVNIDHHRAVIPRIIVAEMKGTAMQQRRRTKHEKTFEERLGEEAQRLREAADKLPHG